MRKAVTVTRFFVGILFILSGLIKANDPLGLSYKMQEFFEVWNASLGPSSFLVSLFTYLHQHSLTLSIVMIALEIMTGVALLLGWQKKLILNTLFFLIIFFTFLTAYAYWSGKFKNCGCFGDCLPISPLTSLIKDVVLLGMIVFLLAGQRFINPVTTRTNINFALTISLLVTIGLQWYVLNYLPIADCLPFKKDNNIAEQMKIPANAVQDSFAMKFIYEKGGQRFEFGPEELPADLSNYKFIDRIQKLIRKGNAEPPIKGFTLIGYTGTDSTSAILNQEKNILVIGERINSAAWINEIKDLQGEAIKKNVF
ncbi:MAG TPA: BT_3928 family protein, partial [Flavisolibacter sp.]|nr:BT_3928 family protein [Flavisolibacter sp.]